jgi:GTP:adenosylcobinamide-phosphate guanylyltransferase
MGVEYSFKTDDGRNVVPVGLNVIDGSKRYGDEWLDQIIFVVNHPELAVNINTVQELALAERLMSERTSSQ